MCCFFICIWISLSTSPVHLYESLLSVACNTRKLCKVRWTCVCEESAKIFIKRQNNCELAARVDFGRKFSHLRVSMPGRNRRSSLRPLIKFPESSRVHPIIEELRSRRLWIKCFCRDISIAIRRRAAEKLLMLPVLPQFTCTTFSILYYIVYYGFEGFDLSRCRFVTKI